MRKNFASSAKWWYPFAFVLGFLASPWAQAGIAAPAVGGAPDNPPVAGSIGFHGGLHTDPAFSGTGWTVGSPTARMSIVADPDAPNWIKVLQLPPAVLFPFSTSLILLEFLHVGPGLAWTDWHERITTQGWEWGPGATLLAEDGQTVPGILSDTNSDGLFETLDFFFNALDPSNDVTIQKVVHCGAPGGCVGEPVLGHGFGILVREFPTVVPESGTLLLLAAGLAGLAASRRRRS